MGQQKTKGYKDTLNLPRTAFSMKANLSEREPEILKLWNTGDIYFAIREERKNSKKKFILHDGPPYANGHIHMGHVLNKILKDICVKYFTMKGFASPYVPGWDCHGLPVEHQLFKELAITKHDIDQVKFREKAYDYAMKYVKIQAEEFKRLGIFAEWDNPYLTLTKDYEANILYAFADLFEKGYIYTDLKPVNWCKTCETALAEAEVEYEDKISPSIYVKFPVGLNRLEQFKTFFVIWTTTPWTLLANTAVALHPDFDYSFVKTGEEIWIMAKDMVKSIVKKLGISDYSILEEKPGKVVSEEIPNAKHPFIDRNSRIVLADYVTKEEGTGCVHTAPGHGQDDYVTGKKYNLPVIMPVEATGKFNTETGEFAGQNVFAANKSIIEKLRSQNMLIKTEDIKHSYPHCWRCKEPIIFRATKQWFMKIDHNKLREKMVEVIKKDVEWIPLVAKDRISAMVETRPDWCLSRQRYWGVPIPAFQCAECGETFTNSAIIRKTADLTRESGANAWFEKRVQEIYPENMICAKCGSGKFLKGNDILDVWFDSGVSHKAVLETREELGFPADLYLEGSDQHRGWFQSALITAMGIKGKAPYRKVLTHGFVVDGEGKKMSKSVGNVISPTQIMKKYGADILRLWVASSDYVGDIKLSSEILERLADGYRKIRNTFRFLLSNLYDFDISKNTVKTDDLTEIDKWMLSRLSGVVEEITGYYDRYEFYKVYRAVYNFCVYEVSAFYLDVLKDVLYVDAPDSGERRSVQTVISRILNTLVRLMAPIISFTTEEVWSVMALIDKEKSVHMAFWPSLVKDLTACRNSELDAKWERILGVRNGVMKLLELKRANNLIGSSLEASIEFYSEDKDTQTFMKDNLELFAGIFKVSQVFVVEKDKEGMESVPGVINTKALVKRALGEKCQRCWNFSETVGKNKDYSDLCQRCFNVVVERSNNG